MTTLTQRPFAVGRTAEIYAWDEGRVLKLYYDWCPRSWIEHEARIGRQIVEAGLPAPQVFDLVQVDGRGGIVYERIDGRSALDALAARPWSINRIGAQIAGLQAQIHERQLPELGSLHESLAAAISRANGLPERLRDAALSRLAELPEAGTLCHFDFHPGQVMLSARGPVILDWMTAVRGHPAADLARTSILYGVGDAPGAGLWMRALIMLARKQLWRAHESHYLALNPRVKRDQIRAWLLPVAAARFEEGIAPERAGLLSLMHSLV